MTRVDRKMMQRSVLPIIVLFLLILMVGTQVFAVPIAPTSLTSLSSSTRNFTTGNKTHNATAGWVTELDIWGTGQVTQGWQGYYGNVSGEIVLDDADNNSLYAWNIVTPGGEILAVRNASVDWSSGQILCANETHAAAENLLIFPGAYSDDADNLTNTFNFTTHPDITIGDNSFVDDECNYSIATFVDDAADANRRFNETLLYSNNTDTLIYVTILNSAANGFKVGGDKYDFQMIVGEDGHDNSDSTTYFFFVELNA